MSYPPEIVVHGVHPSYFTRKVTGYLDYKAIPWRLKHSIGFNPRANLAGWPGGIPVIELPDGQMVWDSTLTMLHLERSHPDPAVSPQDPTLAFLDFLLEDISDEWFYRHALGTRWLFPENAAAASWDMARDASVELQTPIGPIREMLQASITSCLPRLGVTPENVNGWIECSLRPWQRTLAAHVDAHGFLLGGRPCLADFGLFGGAYAHFINDPQIRRLTEETAMPVVRHTHRLMTARDQTYGDWFDPARLPDSLIAVLAEAGRHYLPWVAQATVSGEASVSFEDGSQAQIRSTNFLNLARGVLLARYAAARSPALDGVLERAGILSYFADHLGQATSIPDPLELPRPVDNQPYPIVA